LAVGDAALDGEPEHDAGSLVAAPRARRPVAAEAMAAEPGQERVRIPPPPS